MLADCTVVISARGKRVHAVPNTDELRTLCGRFLRYGATVTDAMPDCPACLRRLTCR